MTITEFLEARIAEDEAAEARKFRVRKDAIYRYQVGSDGFVELETRNGMKYERLSAEDFWAKYGEAAPDARALAECAAKRKMIDLAGTAGCLDSLQANLDYGYDSIEEEMLRALAAVYADHPDYDPAWAL